MSEIEDTKKVIRYVLKEFTKSKEFEQLIENIVKELKPSK